MPPRLLILLPSRLERERLAPEAAPGPEPVPWPPKAEGRVLLASCGVGPALAGARTARLVASVRPERLLLAGLAGSLDQSALPPGSLLVPTRVELHGVGVGEGSAHRCLAEAGGPLAQEAPEAEGPLTLEPPEVAAATRGALLSACAGAADEAEVRERRRRHPGCLAEDMESWAVARAALEAERPLGVLRAISNAAGDRDHSRWAVAESFAALRAALDGLVELGA